MDEKPLTSAEEEIIEWAVATVNAILEEDVRSMVRAQIALRVLTSE